MNKIFYSNSILESNYNYINLNKPMTVFIKITSKCMFKCVFCSQGDSCKDEMNFEDLKKVLKKLKKVGVLRIFYTGGEPFSYSKFKEILEYGHELGFCQLVISNGYLIEKCNYLDLLDGISISIHGMEDTHNSIVGNTNSYKKIMNAIEIIKNKYSNIILDICYTASNLNFDNDNLLFAADLCKKYNIGLTVTRTYNIERGKNDCDFSYISTLIKNVDLLVKNNYNIQIGHCLAACGVEYNYHYLCSICTAGIDFCAIDVNGDVKICANSEQVISNIFKSSFKKIWSDNHKNLNHHINNLSIICKNCINFQRCVGGCKCEHGNMIDGNSDNLSLHVNDKSWSEISSFKYKLYIASINKKSNDRYQIIGEKSCIINKYAYKFLRNLDFSIPLNGMRDINNDEIEFLIMLYRDGFIKRCDNE